jgi:hypothetical protein
MSTRRNKTSHPILKQVQGVLVEKCRVSEQEKIALQTKFDKEKVQMQQEKE